MSEESCSDSDYLISDSDIEDALYTISSHEERKLIRKNYLENNELPDHILEEVEDLREEKRLEDELIEEENICDEYHDKRVKEEIKEYVKEENLNLLNIYNENTIITSLKDINIDNSLSIHLNLETDSEDDDEDDSDNEDDNNSGDENGNEDSLMNLSNIRESPIVSSSTNKRKLSDTEEEESRKKIKTDSENDIEKQLEKYEEGEDKECFKEKYLELLITQCFDLIEELSSMNEEVEKMYNQLMYIYDGSKDSCDNRLFSVINIKSDLLIKYPELTDYDKELTLINKIRLEQRKTNLIIPHSVFKKLVDEIGNDYHNKELKFNDKAIEALQAASEDYLIYLFEIANKLCIHAKRDIVEVKDLSLSKCILKF